MDYHRTSEFITSAILIADVSVIIILRTDINCDGWLRARDGLALAGRTRARLSAPFLTLSRAISIIFGPGVYYRAHERATRDRIRETRSPGKSTGEALIVVFVVFVVVELSSRGPHVNELRGKCNLCIHNMRLRREYSGRRATWLARTLKDHWPFASKRPQRMALQWSCRTYSPLRNRRASYLRVNRPDTDLAARGTRLFRLSLVQVCPRDSRES